MKNATKGALAAVAAGSLLMGGAGSLAYWTDSETITGSAISSGKLSLSQETGQVCGSWEIKHGVNGTLGTYTAGTTKIVPGDILVKACDYTVHAAGANLAATLTLAAPSFAGGSNAALSSALSGAAAVVTLDGSTTAVPAAITSANDADVLNVVVSVPFSTAAADTTTQDVAATLNNLTLTVTQNTPS